jgi:hypothetical protein
MYYKACVTGERVFNIFNLNATGYIQTILLGTGATDDNDHMV